jgi:lipoprotein-anchoring transpeptidase ErfK/SrfK
MKLLSTFLKVHVAAGLAVLVAACNYSSFPDPVLSSRDVELLAMSPQAIGREMDPARARLRMPNTTGERIPGSIIVDNDARFLYFVEDAQTVLRYEISPGMESHQWRGEAVVARKAEWPQWTPGNEARRMAPGLPAVVPGGPNNPLGARALYLHDDRGRDTEFRIHGTNEPEMIGMPVSLGCIRMHNVDVIDLFNRVKLGSRVVVR